MKFIVLSALLLGMASCSHKNSEPKSTLPDSLQAAISSPERTPEFALRDRYRHPYETLTFFGLKKNMTVVEVWPSGGWYTEILAPYLVSEGKYIIADPDADPKGYTTPRKAWLAARPEIAKKVSSTVFMPNDSIKLAEDQSVDMILTFRNVHNWLPSDNQAAAFRVFYKALKPGGVLGVVDHRANTKYKFKPENGYVLENDVVKLAEKAGFRLEAKSEVNANPLDKTDHKDGVWMLPPRLRVPEADKAKYLAIGESDRMTLKFVKPVK